MMMDTMDLSCECQTGPQAFLGSVSLSYSNTGSALVSIEALRRISLGSILYQADDVRAVSIGNPEKPCQRGFVSGDAEKQPQMDDYVGYWGSFEVDVGAARGGPSRRMVPGSQLARTEGLIRSTEPIGLILEAFRRLRGIFALTCATRTSLNSPSSAAGS